MDEKLLKANERISQLEIALEKRSRLIYAMMKTLSHDYQSFMIDESDELLDKMCSRYGVGKIDTSKNFIVEKLKQLGKI